ncbi:MAG TPA: YwqG family protein [Chroococcales cyanobacterium]
MSFHPQALKHYQAAVNFRMANQPAAALAEIERALAFEQQPEYHFERAWAALMIADPAKAEHSLNLLATLSARRPLHPSYQSSVGSFWSQLAVLKGQQSLSPRHQFAEAVAQGDSEALLATLAQKPSSIYKDMLRQSVRLFGKTREGRMGQSKLGGQPDVLEDFEWPEGHDGLPLAFICQLNLSTIELPKPSALPSQGILYFFYEAKEQPWGFDPFDKGQWRVIYQKRIDALWSMEPPDDLPRECIFEPLHVIGAIETTFPEPCGSQTMPLQKEQGLQEMYGQALREWYGEEPWHRLLGYSQNIQGEMELECEMAYRGYEQTRELSKAEQASITAGAKQWRLLLQIDSDESTGMSWGDMGRLYFWIRQEDLRAKVFDNVWLILQCY